MFVRHGNIWIADTYGMGARQLTTSGQDRQPALSPDGRWVAYTSGWGTDSGFGQIFLIPADGGEVQAFRPLGMAGAESPGFSPDGKSLVFVGLSHLIVEKTSGDDQARATMSVSLADLNGGPVTQIVSNPDTILDFGYIYGAPVLSPDGRLVAYQESGSDVSGGFVVLNLKGERLFRFPTESDVATPFWRPRFSPDGQEILCYSPAITEGKADFIYLVNLVNGQIKKVTEGARPTYVEGGKAIVFERRPSELGRIEAGAGSSDLWRLELNPGARPRKILLDGQQPG